MPYYWKRSIPTNNHRYRVHWCSDSIDIIATIETLTYVLWGDWTHDLARAPYLLRQARMYEDHYTFDALYNTVSAGRTELRVTLEDQITVLHADLSQLWDGWMCWRAYELAPSMIIDNHRRLSIVCHDEQHVDTSSRVEREHTKFDSIIALTCQICKVRYRYYAIKSTFSDDARFSGGTLAKLRRLM